MKKHIVITIVVAVVVGVGAFFGGMAVGRSSSAANLRGQFAAFRNGTSTGFTRNGGQGAGLLTGSVIAKDAQSITIQDRTGSSHIVFYATSTQVSKPTPVTIGDLNVGDNVTVTGTSNSDGSLTAQTIDVRGNQPPTGGTQAPMMPAGQ